MLQDRIEKDYIEVYKAHNEEKVSVLRMIKSSLQNAEIAKKDKLEDEEVIVILKREVKQRNEASETYRSAGKSDVAEREENEIKIIEEYLPTQLGEDEIRTIVQKVISENKLDKSKTGQAIGMAMKEYHGQAEGSLVAKIVQEELNK